jgi:uncharacterized protein YgbK (DUF1537 family)
MVLADDFTSAAEVAAVALRHGLAAQVVRDKFTAADEATLTVCDTDTRSLAPAQAARVVAAVAAAISPGPLLYKKIDSVLRGPVRAEIEALLMSRRLRRAVIVPQNPSMGRVIVDGKYQIAGVDLSRTAFGHDPQHPARTSDVLALLGGGELPIAYCQEPQLLPQDGLVVCGGNTQEHLLSWAAAAGLDESTLAAGGAEFFAAVLQRRGCRPRPLESAPPRLEGSVLCVCGSTSLQSRDALQTAAARGAPLLSMPEAQEARRFMQTHGRAILSTPAQSGSAAPRDLERQMAELVAAILGDYGVDWLLIEGGATASAILRQLQWDRFGVVAEFSPGVAHLRPAGGEVNLVVKPGSYGWPGAIWNQLIRPVSR